MFIGAIVAQLVSQPSTNKVSGSILLPLIHGQIFPPAQDTESQTHGALRVLSVHKNIRKGIIKISIIIIIIISTAL